MHTRPCIAQLTIDCCGGAVVLGHFVAEPRGLTSRFLSRGHVAVSLYIVLSGFVTHLAYHSKSFTTLRSTYIFYLRRFGRIWLTYYFSCVLGFSHHILFHQLLPWTDYVMPLLLLDAWEPAAREPPPQYILQYIPPQSVLCRPRRAPPPSLHRPVLRARTRRPGSASPQPQPGRLDAQHPHPRVGGVPGLQHRLPPPAHLSAR